MWFQKIFFNQLFYGFLPKEVIVHGQQKLVCGKWKVREFVLSGWVANLNKKNNADHWTTGYINQVKFTNKYFKSEK